MVKNIESSSKSSAPDEPTKESFFQRLDISYSISESSNTSNPVSISTSMRKRNSFLEEPIKNQKLREIYIKKVNKSLNTSKSQTYYIQDMYPDLKAEEKQCCKSKANSPHKFVPRII